MSESPADYMLEKHGLNEALYYVLEMAWCELLSAREMLMEAKQKGEAVTLRLAEVSRIANLICELQLDISDEDPEQAVSKAEYERERLAFKRSTQELKHED